MNKSVSYSHINGLEVAVIGMVGRFPGAPDTDTFWENLKAGIESTTTFSTDELLAAGVHPDLLANPQYVRSGAILEDIDLFDAHFFEYSPREVEVMDPQQRIFLECAWEALENAGYAAEHLKGEVGVYAGVNMNTYFFNLLAGLDPTESMENLHLLTGNDKDYLTTRLSYKLNLKGPAVTVQTACSTSLVAVHLACRSLLSGDCDMALAGGISIRIPQKAGFMYHEGGIYSPDGHCRAFDADSKGTTFGSGVGIVVLKRLEDAIADRDTIHAVIKGSAINNDGAAKVGYTAPGVHGQASVIRSALLSAEIEPETISYVEAHGTGTPLGDPIEVMALTEAFRTHARNYCALGSVKTNIGHLDTAAGVAGLIKTIQALKHREIPASLHFQQPNPKINFAASPFFVNTTLREWQSNGLSRRAGVSSFGVGGTNAHVILEEAPVQAAASRGRPWQLLMLSAKTATGLDQASARLADFLAREEHVQLADVAYTLQVGRKTFPFRRMIICQNREQAIALLHQPEDPANLTAVQEEGGRPVVFLFPGQGSQYPHMAQTLYQTEATFRQHVDQCCQLLKASLRQDLRSLLFSALDDLEKAAQVLQRTEYVQPALFVVEYALAKLWLSWGIKPQALLGHSIGEYVAACLAGVFSLEDALSLVAMRGKLMQQQPAGQMLTVSLAEADLRARLPVGVDIAAVNSAALCVVSGPQEKITAFEEQLRIAGTECRPLHTSHAFHSAMMEPLLPFFMERVRRMQLHAPQLPFISNVTGTWASAADVTNPGYWVRHLRQTVRFADGIEAICKDAEPIFLEVGPGHTLGTFVRQHLRASELTQTQVLSSLPHPQARESDLSVALTTLGQLWLAGASIDWQGFYAQEQRYRIALPTYAFERQRFWTGAAAELAAGSARLSAEAYLPAGVRPVEAQPGDLFPPAHLYVPGWKRSLPLPAPEAQPGGAIWLCFTTPGSFQRALIQQLTDSGQAAACIEVYAGERFGRERTNAYRINPRTVEDYSALLSALQAEGRLPHKIFYLWCLDNEDDVQGEGAHEGLEHDAFYSLFFLAQALSSLSLKAPIALEVVANRFQQVAGDERLLPEKALLLGPCRVIPQEYPDITCRAIDITLPAPGSKGEMLLCASVLAEVAQQSQESLVAYRGQQRWTPELSEVDARYNALAHSRLRQGGVYLLTGGLGGVGLALAGYLARTQQARLILVSRTTLPLRTAWPTLAQQQQDHALREKIQAVQQLERAGAEVLLIQADVTDRRQMEQAIEQSLAHFGTLHGVIHAAGSASGELLQFKHPAQIHAVMDGKVTGARTLVAALDGMDLDFCIFCSSTVALSGAIGQIDYCAANNFLDTFAASQTAQQDTFTASINWDGWEQTGMNRYQSSLHASLLDHVLEKDAHHAAYLTTFDAQKHWVLAEHQVQGRPALPGTAYVQMLREACRDFLGTQPITLKNVFFLQPLWVDDRKEVYTILEKAGDTIDFRIVSAHAASLVDGLRLLEHVKGTITVAEALDVQPFDLKAIKQRCPVQQSSFEALQVDSLVTWGPRWQGLQSVYIGQDEALAAIALPDSFGADVEQMDVHPALLDVATSFAGMASGSQAYLPLMYGRISLLQPLPRKIFSYARRKEQTSETAETLVFDLTILGEQGEQLVRIEDFTLFNEALFAQKEAGANPGPKEKSLTDDLLLAGILIRRADRALSPDRAIAALARILQGPPVAQVVVSARDMHRPAPIPAAVVGPAVENGDAAMTTHHMRPNLATAYVAPRSAVETQLVDIWQDALGIEQVGVHDNFFDLGGHSLLAVQIVDRLRKTFDLSLPLSELIQAPTIEMLARVLDQRLAEKEEQEKMELLSLLETLSDEEVEKELRKRGLI